MESIVLDKIEEYDADAIVSLLVTMRSLREVVSECRLSNATL
jgi:hypothetical protein